MQDWLQHNGTPMPVHAQQQTPDLGQRMLAALTAAATGAAGSSSNEALQEPAGCCSCGEGEASKVQQHGRTATAAEVPAGSATQLQQLSRCATQQQGQHQEQVKQQQQQQQGSRYSAVMVIGTDIPDLSTAVLDAAAAALATHDVVLGPARDGGFYLLGFRTEALLKPEVQSGQVFESVQWSTDSVLLRTVAGVERLGLRLAPVDTLPVLQDVDTLQDLQAWYQQPAVQQQQQQGVGVPGNSSKKEQQGSEDQQQQHRQLLLQHACALIAAH
jgi:glycosyltransferase A (GT-A) superfamily protein (DUF2064 family)